MRVRVGALALVACLASAAPADAATTIGQTSTPGTCGPNPPGLSVFQSAVAGPPSYTVPASGGVITSWSHQAASYPSASLRLKFYRPTTTPDDFFVVGESSVETIAPSVLNTFPTRIPVQAGDLLGLATLSSESGCAFSTGAAGDHFRPGFDSPPGSTTTFGPGGGFERVNASAVLEPDGDGDGFGDETQDCLPADPSAHECPETTITKGPKHKTEKKTATFEFTSSIPGATFECKLDKGAFAPCTSPHKVKVKEGKHSFAVRATDAAGNVDGSPATDDWKVKKKK